MTIGDTHLTWKNYWEGMEQKTNKRISGFRNKERVMKYPMKERQKRIGAYLVEWAQSQKVYRGWQWVVTDEDDEIASGHSCHDDATAVACAEAVVRVLEDARRKRISLGAADVKVELRQEGK